MSNVKETKMNQRFIAAILALVMALTLIPIGVLAEEEPATPVGAPYWERYSAGNLPEEAVKNDSNGHYYYVFDESVQWEEAKEYCEKMGGHLVTITSREEQSFVESIVDTSIKDCLFIGATIENGESVWVTDEEFDYANWNDGEPNNTYGQETVLMLYAHSPKGKWNDTMNDGERYGFYSIDHFGFICEWDYEKGYDKKLDNSIETPGTMEALTEYSLILDGHRYQLFQTFMKFLDTEEYLEARNCHLATISSELENDEITSYFTKYAEYTSIGFSDYENEGDWKWVDGTPITYENWSPGEPNNEFGKEDWALIHLNGLWNDGKWDYSVSSSEPVIVLVEWDSEEAYQPGDPSSQNQIVSDDNQGNKDSTDGNQAGEGSLINASSKYFPENVWSFVNFGHDACKMSDYQLRALLALVKSASCRKMLMDSKKYGFGGHCYGMSVSSILNYSNVDSIAKSKGYTELSEMTLEESESTLCYYQVTQKFPVARAAVQRTLKMPDSERLKLLKQYVEQYENSGSMPVLIDIEKNPAPNEPGWAHALVAFHIEKGTYVSNKTGKVYPYRFLVYDPNTVDKANYILFDNSTWRWELPYYSLTSDNAHFKRITNQEKDIAVKNQRSAANDFQTELVIKSFLPMQLVLAEEAAYQWYLNFEDGQYQDQLNKLVTYIDSLDGDEDELRIILPSDQSISLIPKSKGESLEFAIQSKEKYITVKCESVDKVTIEELERVVIDESAGAIEISIADDSADTMDFDTYSVSGVVTGDAVIDFGGDGVEIESGKFEKGMIQASTYEAENIIETSTVIDATNASKRYGREKDALCGYSDTQNGIKKDANGVWAKFVNGKVDTSYSGIAKNRYGWWRIRDGYVDFDAQGIYPNKYGWWKTTNGKVTFKETGIFQNEFGWWRVKDSKVDFNANGIYPNKYGWWKTTNGKVTFKENGVFQNEFGWWKVKNSKVDFTFTGIASNKYGSWYINKGKVDFSKNGKVNYNGKTYTVKNGKVH